MENLKKDKKSKLIIPVAVISILVIAIAVTLYSNKRKIEARANAVPREASAIPVKIASVELKAVDDNIELTGSFEARQTLPLIAEAQGSIIQLNIHEGQSISAGQIVAQIDPTSLQASLASAQATYNNAIKNKERYERLAEAGAISQKQYEDVALSVEKARTDMKNIQQQIVALKIPHVEMKELSMGMSGDLETAIEEGATIVRVGTAVFGKRIYPDSYYWNENK